MKKLNLNKLKKYLPILLLALAVVCCNLAIADVGNNNRYSSGGGDFGGGDGDLGVLIGYLLGLFIEDPSTGFIVLLIILAVIFISRRKQKKQASDPTYINRNVQQQAENDFTFDNSTVVAEEISSAGGSVFAYASIASAVRKNSSQPFSASTVFKSRAPHSAQSGACKASFSAAASASPRRKLFDARCAFFDGFKAGRAPVCRSTKSPIAVSIDSFQEFIQQSYRIFGKKSTGMDRARDGNTEREVKKQCENDFCSV